MSKLRHHITYLIFYFFTIFVLLYGGYAFGFELLSLFTVLLISGMVIIDLLTEKNKIWSPNMVWLVTFSIYLLWLILGSGFKFADSMQSVYRIFTEMFLLSAGLILSRRISDFLEQTQTVLKEISFSHLSPPKPLKDMVNAIEIEICRSLRYDRPLAMLLIDVIPQLDTDYQQTHISRLQHEMLEGYFNTRVGHEIVKLTRNMDIAASGNKIGIFYLLCPETDEHSIVHLAERIHLAIEEHFDATVRWGAAGVNQKTPHFADLLGKAEIDLENRSVNPQVRFEEEELSEA
jgi:hypothetical protein